MPVKLERIGHCALRVRDIERAKKFYIDVLGFQFMEQDPDHGGVFMSLPGDGHTIDITPVEDPKNAAPASGGRDRVGLAHIAFRVLSYEGLKDAYDGLIANGVEVLEATFDLLLRSHGPVLEDFPEETGTTDLPQASSVTATADPIKGDPANEVTALRAFYERWVEAHGGRSAVGLSGIPQRRFRGMVRFMQSYARGEEVDMKERPEDVPLAQFIRYCVDDLKAFFLEARMAQRPDTEPPELHTWFWGETAAGQMVAAIAEHMKSSGDAALERIANGIAR